jgi:pyruvate/oxaloacetate carboxyltransferase
LSLANSSSVIRPFYFSLPSFVNSSATEVNEMSNEIAANGQGLLSDSLFQLALQRSSDKIGSVDQTIHQIAERLAEGESITEISQIVKSGAVIAGE